MCTIYENIKVLCDEKGIKPGKMCVDIGISKSILTGLKNGTKKNIQTDTAQKIANYFDVSVDYLMNLEKYEQTINEQYNGGSSSYAQKMIDHGFVRNPNYRKDGHAWIRAGQKEKSPTPEGVELNETQQMAWDLIQNMDEDKLKAFIAGAKAMLGGN